MLHGVVEVETFSVSGELELSYCYLPQVDDSDLCLVVILLVIYNVN